MISRLCRTLESGSSIFQVVLYGDIRINEGLLLAVCISYLDMLSSVSGCQISDRFPFHPINSNRNYLFPAFESWYSFCGMPNASSIRCKYRAAYRCPMNSSRSVISREYFTSLRARKVDIPRGLSKFTSTCSILSLDLRAYAPSAR